MVFGVKSIFYSVWKALIFKALLFNWNYLLFINKKDCFAILHENIWGGGEQQIFPSIQRVVCSIWNRYFNCDICDFSPEVGFWQVTARL